MTYKEALAYIEEIGQYGSILGLDNMRRLLEHLDHPERELKFIHVAGTNGKGSTIAFLNEALKQGGYSVGRYVSPTLQTYCERIQCNGKAIPKATLARYVEQVKGVCQELVSLGFPHPTVFEVETVIGFLYFKDKNCDLVLLETGLGGLEDATNIVENTLIAIITSISMDHMAFLGESLAQIASIKSGIIKKGSHVVWCDQKDESAPVIEKACIDRNGISHVIQMEDRTSYVQGKKNQTFSYKHWKKMKIALLGEHQVTNAMLALETLDCLKDLGYGVLEEIVRKAFWETTWFGRLTLIGTKPEFYVDGAHNEDAALKLAQAIKFYFTNKKIIYIMGILRDKEFEKIVKLTYPYASHIITVTPPNNPRGLHAYELAQVVQEYHGTVTVADGLQEAVEMSYLLADEQTVVVAFGSLSYLGELTTIVENRNHLHYDL